MSAATNLDPVLLRQLKKAGARSVEGSVRRDVAKFLAAVNDHYRHLNDDRARILTRSMKL